MRRVGTSANRPRVLGGQTGVTRLATAKGQWQIMKRWRWPSITVVLLSLFAAFSRSSGAAFDLTAEQSFMSRAEVRQQGAVTVRAAVLTDDESARYFGASLADQGHSGRLAKRGQRQRFAAALSTDCHRPKLLLGPRSRTVTSRLVARQNQCIDCSGSSASPDAGCDPAKANRCRLRLHAP